MRRRTILLIAFALAALLGWVLTAPDPLDEPALTKIAAVSATADTGRDVFWAAGCASCHTAPGAEKSDAPSLAGGQKFPSDFGTFLAPNISQDETHGIGGWSLAEFANAVQRGVSPDGQHYYPAFPYNAYNKMTPDDVAALYAFMKTLPADATPSQPHEVGFPFNIRRSLGGWKLFFANDTFVLQGNANPEIARGRYLVEALSHCGECHSPRNVLGGIKRAEWLSGAPDPSGKGTIPNITPAKLDWVDLDIMNYLTTGFTPEFDTAGGHMVPVIENLARLPESDRLAIVAYLNAVAPVE